MAGRNPFISSKKQETPRDSDAAIPKSTELNDKEPSSQSKNPFDPGYGSSPKDSGSSLRPAEHKSNHPASQTTNLFSSDFTRPPQDTRKPLAAGYFPPAKGLFDDVEEEDEEQGVSNLSLEYLHPFSREELVALEKQHGKPSTDLDCVMHENQEWYRFFFLPDTLFALGSEIAMTPFQMVTGRDGLQAGLKLLKSNAELSSSLGLTLSAPLALSDLAYKISTVSAQKEAIKRTLHYALSDTYENKLHKLASSMSEQPLQTTGRLVQWGFHQTVRHSKGLLRGAVNVLAFYEPVEFSLPFKGPVSIPAWLPALSTGAQVSICSGLLYSGHRYSSIFLDSNYEQNFQDFIYQGLVDLWENNPGGEPWLVGELFRGNFSTPLQISLRGLTSTFFTRAYPRFYYIAETAFEKFAGLDPATSAKLALGTTTLAGWHLFCTEYPQSYRRAMGDRIKIDALLRANLEISLGEALTQLVDVRMNNLTPALSHKEITARKQAIKRQLLSEFVTAERQLLQSEVAQAQEDGFVFAMNPRLKYEISGQALAGFCLGGTAVAPLLLQYINAPLTVYVLCLVGLPSLLALTCYRTEKERTINHLVRKKIDQESKPESPEKPPIGALIISSHVSRALSVLGTGKRTFGNNQAALSTTVFLLAENFMELLHFSSKKAQSLLERWLWPWSRNPESASVSTTAGTFFSTRAPRSKKTMEIPGGTPTPEKSWTAWIPNPFGRRL